MSWIRSSLLLRRALIADAVCSGTMGIAMLSFAAVLGGELELPARLFAEAGIVLLPFAAFVAFLATRAQPARFAVWTVIVLNLIWAVDSVLLLLTGWVAPNALGYAFIIGQAVVVLIFADLQYLGLRRSAAAAV